MPTKPRNQELEAPQVREPEAQIISVEEVAKLKGFVAMVSERWGYLAGRKMKSAELSDITKIERDVVKVARKGYVSAVQLLISGESDAEYDQVRALRLDIGLKEKELNTASNTLSEKAKPFREAMKPLNQAIRHLDTVVIPDSLKELGRPIEARFSLSQWVQDRLADAAKKKKAQK